MRRIVGAAAVVTVALAVLAVQSLPDAGADAATTSGPAWPYEGEPGAYEVTTESVTIEAADGTPLVASLSRPTTASPDGRAWPLVVLPGTFAGDEVLTDFVGGRLAERGYVTIATIQRGFSPSGGLVDGGGPKSVDDVSRVIDWAIATQGIDQERIGLCGLSYGGGVALIAAAEDPRIDAVASLSGWADLERAFVQNDTVANFTVNALRLVLDDIAGGKPDEETDRAFDDLVNGEDLTSARQYARVRSVSSYMDKLNANGPALFIGEPMNETVFPIDQMVDFWDAYTGGPKHIDLRPGDHGGPETLQEYNVLTKSWAEAFRWMDAHVAGTDTSIAQDAPVQVYPRGPFGFRDAEGYQSTEAPRRQRMWLRTQGTPPVLTLNTLSPTQPPAGPLETYQPLREGTNVLIRPLIPLGSFFGELATGVPPSFPRALIDPGMARIWATAPQFQTLKYRGELEADLAVTPSAPTGTLVVYAFDIPPLGSRVNMITRAPVSFSGATPGQEMRLPVTLPYNAFDIPAGHQLGIMVITDDVSYVSQNPRGATLTIGSSSYVDVPLG